MQVCYVMENEVEVHPSRFILLTENDTELFSAINLGNTDAEVAVRYIKMLAHVSHNLMEEVVNSTGNLYLIGITHMLRTVCQQLGGDQ